MQELDAQQPSPNQTEPAAPDDFYRRMLDKALAKYNPDLKEVRALLSLLAKDGENPEQVYQAAVQARNKGLPEAPDYQSVAPAASSAPDSETAEPTPDSEILEGESPTLP